MEETQNVLRTMMNETEKEIKDIQNDKDFVKNIMDRSR